jgi:RloB-like protein
MPPRQRRLRPPRDLSRRVGTREPRKTIVVFCEGKVTEPEYLEALKRQPEVRDVAAVDIRVEQGRGGSLLALIDNATDARRRAEEEDDEIDEVWCVFDVEWPKHHQDLSSALRRAESTDLRLAVSNPCFELWLVLHFQDQSRLLSSAEAHKLRRTLDGTTGKRSKDKSIQAARYMGCVRQAAHRAAALEERHQRDLTDSPKDNPSSSMHKLLQTVGLKPQRP